MSETFDRSQLDGKDREQLSEIAAATARDAQDHDVNDTDTGSVDRAHQGQQQWRDDDGSGNKRRRRRRGRDRERNPADGRLEREGRPERVERGDDYGGELIDIEG